MAEQVIFKVYCLFCKKEVQAIYQGTVAYKNGRKARTGKCPVCGKSVQRIDGVNKDA